MSTESTSSASPSELVSGFLAVISIASSILAIFWHPIRVSPFAILLALIATGMATRGSRLPAVAVVVGSLCFFVGLTIAVTTNNPLY